MSLQTTPEVDRAWNSTESAQKEGDKGKGTEFSVQGVCTKIVLKFAITNRDLGTRDTESDLPNTKGKHLSRQG